MSISRKWLRKLSEDLQICEHGLVNKEPPEKAGIDYLRYLNVLISDITAKLE